MFFHHMAKPENASYLYYAIKCFIDYMSDFTSKEIEAEQQSTDKE